MFKIVKFSFNTSTSTTFNYYQILNLHPKATTQQIKTRYYQLAKQFHPDINTQQQKTTEQFKKINEAYQTLKNHNSRLEYNRKIGFDRYQHDYHFYNSKSENYNDYCSEKQKIYKAYNAKANQTQSPLALLMHIFQIALILTGSYFLYHGFLTKKYTEHQIRRQNMIMSRENINSSPTVIERRKQQYAQQIIDKKIKMRVVELNVRGAGQQSTRAKKKRMGLQSIPGIAKKKTPNQQKQEDENPINRRQYY